MKPTSTATATATATAQATIAPTTTTERASVYLPFFPGFYESPLWYSDMESEYFYEELDNLRDAYNDRTLSEGDFEVDYEGYEEACCRMFCDAFEGLAPAFVERVKFGTLHSPREYNYSTDHCEAVLTLGRDWREQVLEFIRENERWLAPRIREDWTSRDGFWSFLSSDINEWAREFEKERPEDNYTATVIAYMMIAEHSEEVREWLYLDVLDNCDLGEFVSLKKK